MPLQVIVVGAGIAGLAAAIGFARHGHTVLVLERHRTQDQEQDGSAIQLQPNAIRILKRWNMMNDLQKVAHNNEAAEMRQPGMSQPLAYDSSTRRGGAYTGLRRDMRDLFRSSAIKHGVEIRDGVKITKVDPSGPTVFLDNGSTMNADFVVGADGAYSHVRQSLFPSIQPKVTSTCIFQITLPMEFIEANPETQALTKGPLTILHFSAGRNIFSSPIPSREVFDFQFTDDEYTFDIDPHPDVRHERVYDMDWLRGRFSDHGSGIQNVLQEAKSYWKWRLTEVTGLPSWSSPNGKVVIVGDAAHAMRPNSGQGSAMGIEDGAMLSELLANASPADDLQPIIRQFEKSRIYRCHKVYQLAVAYSKTWTLADPIKIARRNKIMSKLKDLDYTNVQPNSDAPFDSAPFRKWLDEYDVFEEARRLLDSHDKITAKI